MPDPDKDTAILACFFHEWEAEIIRAVLEEAGLPCVVSTRWDGHGGAVTDTSSGFRVLVKVADLHHARDVLEQARQAGKELPSEVEG